MLLVSVLPFSVHMRTNVCVQNALCSHHVMYNRVDTDQSAPHAHIIFAGTFNLYKLCFFRLPTVTKFGLANQLCAVMRGHTLSGQ